MKKPSEGHYLAALGACLALSCGTGCNTGAHHPRTPTNLGPVEATAVSDDAFAGSVHMLLRDGKASKERQALLAGVVKRQLAHAETRLSARQRERGYASLLGALYLVRGGELQKEMIEGSDHALALALDVVAGSGDEGRSLALYDLRKLGLPANSPQSADIDQHVGALSRWIGDTQEGTDNTNTEVTGAAERRAVARALLEPTDPAVTEAVDATVRWIDASITFQQSFRADPHARPRREIAIEGFRGISSGAATLAAIFLRSGDAAGALDALNKTSVEQVTPPGLLQRLQTAASRGDAQDYRALLEMFARPDAREDETSVDRDLIRAAVFGLAVEAYRRDPTQVDVASKLATELVELGMPEVAPAVLADAAQKHPDANLVSTSLDGIARILFDEEAAGDAASAHRVFAAAAPILDLASKPELAGRVKPTASAVRLLAATIDGHAGDLVSSRAEVTAALKTEPTAEGHRLLGDIERQSGNSAAALTELAEVARLADGAGDRTLSAEAHLVSSDVAREAGDADRGRKELGLAVSAIGEARAKTPPEARTERMFARILDRTGDDAGAARASERAVTAARGDVREVGLILLDAVARTYVARDLDGARRFAQRALAAQIRDDDLIYAGLWVQALERELKAPTDGTAERIFQSIHGGSVWTTKLVAWASGKLSDADLAAAARTPGQRTEAQFYQSLARRAAGDQAGSDAALREVAKAPSIDLMEAQIARDLLDGDGRHIRGLAVAGP